MSIDSASLAQGAAAVDEGPAPAGSGPRAAGGRHRRRARIAESLVGYTFAAPNLVLLGIFLFAPLVGALVLSFQRYGGFGDARWIGGQNYLALLQDPIFWQSLGTTIVFTIATLVGSMALGLGLAVLLDKAMPGRAVFRTIVYIPMVVSGVATGLIAVLMFDENVGVLDKLLAAIGLPTVAWQSNGAAALISVILMTIWGRTGFTMVIYLAGLQGISPDLLESASIEGANAWQRFRAIVLPLLGPSTFFLLIMNVIYSFQVFDLIYVLTGGGPGNATNVLVTYAYDTAFTVRAQGLAAAIGMVLLVIMLAFTVIQWRASRSKDVVE